MEVLYDNFSDRCAACVTNYKFPLEYRNLFHLLFIYNTNRKSQKNIDDNKCIVYNTNRKSQKNIDDIDDNLIKSFFNDDNKCSVCNTNRKSQKHIDDHLIKSFPNDYQSLVYKFITFDDSMRWSNYKEENLLFYFLLGIKFNCNECKIEKLTQIFKFHRNNNRSPFEPFEVETIQSNKVSTYKLPPMVADASQHPLNNFLNTSNITTSPNINFDLILIRIKDIIISINNDNISTIYIATKDAIRGMKDMPYFSIFFNQKIQKI